jgi:hypothetical protein
MEVFADFCCTISNLEILACDLLQGSMPSFPIAAQSDCQFDRALVQNIGRSEYRPIENTSQLRVKIEEYAYNE